MNPGAPVKAIQELAGHADLTMTQRYMHLSPAALDAAIQLLGLKFTISGFHWFVGWRWLPIDGFRTEFGTLEPTPMCAL